MTAQILQFPTVPGDSVAAAELCQRMAEKFGYAISLAEASRVIREVERGKPSELAMKIANAIAAESGIELKPE